jgi:hypothetical protein
MTRCDAWQELDSQRNEFERTIDPNELAPAGYNTTEAERQLMQAEAEIRGHESVCSACKGLL